MKKSIILVGMLSAGFTYAQDYKGKVGIGIDTPIEKLDVAGNIIARGTGDVRAYIGGDANPLISGASSDVEIGSIKTGIIDITLYNRTDGKLMNLFANDIRANQNIRVGNLSGDGERNVMATADGTLKIGGTLQNLQGSTSVVITNNQIQRAALTGDVIAAVNNNTVTINNEAITTPKLANNAVTSAKIADGTIVGADIANKTITADKLADDAFKNIYNTDGTLNSNRTVTMGGNNLMFTGSGNVGIGTSTPTWKLDVSGGGRILGSADHMFRLQRNGSSDYTDFVKRENGTFLITNNTSNLWNDGIAIDANGNIGFGTQSPTTKLDVRGNVLIQGSTKITDLSGVGDRNVMVGADGTLKIGGTLQNLQGSTSVVITNNQIQRAALTGDVTAAANNNVTTVTALQGKSISSTVPTNGQVLEFVNGTWTPTNKVTDTNTTYTAGTGLALTGTTFSVNPAGIALGGDVTGNANATVVNKLQGKPIASTVPTNGQVLEFVNGTWTPTNKVIDTNTTYTGSTSVILSSGSFQRAALTGDVTAAVNNNTVTINNEAITTAKLANNAVTSAKIVDGSVATVDLANDAVTSAKIANGTIIADDLANNAVTSVKIADGTIVGADIANKTITADKLADDAFKNIYNTDGTLNSNRTVTMGTYNLMFTGSGNVGIGTSIPGAKFDIAGDVRTNAVIYNSDARLKTGVKNISNATATINGLRSVTYTWNDLGKKRGGNDKLQYGFIAQEVEKVLPTLVNTDAEGYKSVNYVAVVPVLVKALQEKDEELKALKAEVEAIKKALKK